MTDTLDTVGLTRLILALNARCCCERGEAQEECHGTEVDRWWQRWARDNATKRAAL
jgi:hypothetical protein